MTVVMARAVKISAAVTIALASLGSRDIAGQRRASDAEVKATYLFQFGRFVRWPAGAMADGAPFTVCVLGRDPFGAVLDQTMAEETVGGRNIAVKRLAGLDEGRGCQIVFVSADEEPRLGAILDTLGRSSILTVSDMRRFSERGGMVEFVSVDNRIRFEINLQATEAAQLSPSSELLRVAATIRRRTSAAR
jgi:hypothetical protein